MIGFYNIVPRQYDKFVLNKDVQAWKDLHNSYDSDAAFISHWTALRAITGSEMMCHN
jgi:hypothetical protein